MITITSIRLEKSANSTDGQTLINDYTINIIDDKGWERAEGLSIPDISKTMTAFEIETFCSTACQTYIDSKYNS